MGEVVLGAVVKEVVSKVVSIAAEPPSLARGFKKELKRLGESLELIQAFLQDAEEIHTNNNSIKLWLQRLEDVAHEADDVLDEFTYEILQRKVIGKRIRRKVRNFFTPSNSIAFRSKMAYKVKGVLKSLDDLNKLANRFGLQPRARDPNTLIPISGVETISFPGESRIFGRENDVSKVVELLVNPKDKQVLSIVPIVGMPGLGKTALAKSVYNDVKAESHFDVKFWVCVSDHFDVKRILKEMFDHFLDEQTSISESMNVNVIVMKMKEQMQKEGAKRGKEHIKYLLVLDDVWNVENWEELKNSLTAINKNGGNGVIVTTRSQDVASVVQAVPNRQHQPGRLEDDECWSIIKERASGGSPMSQELELIGMEIAKLCKGVPLAAKVIAGTMLKVGMTPGAWLDIQN